MMRSRLAGAGSSYMSHDEMSQYTSAYGTLKPPSTRSATCSHIGDPTELTDSVTATPGGPAPVAAAVAAAASAPTTATATTTDSAAEAE